MAIRELELVDVERLRAVRSTTTASISTSFHSRPYAPAFIRTPPPAVPGIADANSNPPRPAARARWRHTAFAAPPPATSRRPRCEPRRARPRASARARRPRRRGRARSSRARSPRPHSLLARPAQQLVQLVDRLRPREPARRAAGADRRVAREATFSSLTERPEQADCAVDVARADDEQHVARPRATAQPLDALSTVGVHAGEHARSLSASTTSLPVTPGTGCSRAA